MGINSLPLYILVFRFKNWYVLCLYITSCYRERKATSNSSDPFCLY
nr:MAG TPA: hypothetical protein [Caudoviricetes sp.]